MATATLAEQVGVEATGPDEFISTALPIRLGNMLPIAYGGCAISLAINAAVRTVGPNFYLYSALGHFLGPASTDAKLKCKVHHLRTTRTFSTRRVDVMQTQANGQDRICLVLTADFQVQEAAMYEYTIPPSLKYQGPAEAAITKTIRDEIVEKGYITELGAKMYDRITSVMDSFFDARLCREGIAGQNLGGAAKVAPTTQDHLPITSKVSGDWFKTRLPLSKDDQYAALSFIMDAALSFTPLVHDHKFLEDAGACSTLDFALRIFVKDLDINNWHLREKLTSRAAEGRTFSEARVWDEQGNMVASMSQQSIMRPPQVRKAAL